MWDIRRTKRPVREDLRGGQAEMRRLRGFSVNPWATGSRFIISHRLLTDEVYSRLQSYRYDESFAAFAAIQIRSENRSYAVTGRNGTSTSR